MPNMCIIHLFLRLVLILLLCLLCHVFQAIKTRFARVLEDNDALLAAATLPKFKLRWLRDQERKDLVKASSRMQKICPRAG